MAHLDGLWSENAEAWNIFQRLCGRTVRDCQLEGWLLERLTAGWEWERCEALLARLDTISGALSPDGRTEDRHSR